MNFPLFFSQLKKADRELDRLSGRLSFYAINPLNTEEEKEKFEEAGAHEDKCTSVVAKASQWTAELLLEEGLLSL